MVNESALIMVVIYVLSSCWTCMTFSLRRRRDVSIPRNFVRFYVVARRRLRAHFSISHRCHHRDQKPRRINNYKRRRRRRIPAAAAAADERPLDPANHHRSAGSWRSRYHSKLLSQLLRCSTGAAATDWLEVMNFLRSEFCTITNTLEFFFSHTVFVV